MKGTFGLVAAALVALCAAKAGDCENCTHALSDTPFFEDFQSGTLGKFVLSKKSKYAGQPVAVQQPKVYSGEANDMMLVLQHPARHYAVSAPLAYPVSAADGLVVQYEARFQEGLQCGGAYVKLLNATQGWKAELVDNESPYVIMFGPDRCGATDKVHFIIRFRNPVDGSVEEKHLVDAPRVPSDKLSHLYTLVIRTDDSFAVKIDNNVVKEGSLTSNTLFSPPILPKEQIDDPTDIKPADWVDQAKIVDASATKPEDWDEDAPEMIEDSSAMKPAGWLDDEPEYIPDPQAEKPEGWDDEEDGEWEAPLVENPKCKEGPGCGTWKQPMKRNPAYKGKWSPPLIDNPAYKGVWKPRQIPNPAFFTDAAVHELSGAFIAGIAVEVWTMQGGLSFDNFLITTDEAKASELAETQWRVKHDAQEGAMKAEDRAARKAERLEAYNKGGAFDKVGYYAAEIVDLATDYPWAFAGTIAGVVVLGIFACFCMMSSPAGGDEDFIRGTGAGHHGHSHAHGEHGHSHGIESDDEGAPPTGADSARADTQALKKAAAAMRKAEAAQAAAASTTATKEADAPAPAATEAAAPAPAPAATEAAAPGPAAASEESADAATGAAPDASPASGGVRKRATKRRAAE